jgi:hypothetical protein
VVDLIPALLTLAARAAAAISPSTARTSGRRSSGAPSPTRTSGQRQVVSRRSRKGDWKLVKVYLMLARWTCSTWQRSRRENNVAPQHWDLVRELEARLGRC